MATYSRTETFGNTEVHYLEKGFSKKIGIGFVGNNIKYQYDYCLPVQCGDSYYYVVGKNNKFGIVGVGGKVLIPCAYNKITQPKPKQN